MTEQEAEEISQFIEIESEENNLKTLDIFIDLTFKLIIEHQLDNDIFEEDKFGKIILQMIFTKLYHIKQLYVGIDYPGLNVIKDPSLICNSVRNLTETVAVFNWVFVQSKSESEKKLKMLIWELSSKMYYKGIPEKTDLIFGSEFAIQNNNTIELLNDSIAKNDAFKALNDKQKDKFWNIIKSKEYKLKIDEGLVKQMSWQDLLEDLPNKSGLLDHKYKHLSFFSHPSFLSVEQFRRSFSHEDRAWKELSIYSIVDCFVITGVFLNDYMTVFPNTIKTFEKETTLNQFVVTLYNTLVRSHQNR
jgi:hypothetical protein